MTNIKFYKKKCHVSFKLCNGSRWVLRFKSNKVHPAIIKSILHSSRGLIKAFWSKSMHWCMKIIYISNCINHNQYKVISCAWPRVAKRWKMSSKFRKHSRNFGNFPGFLESLRKFTLKCSPLCNPTRHSNGWRRHHLHGKNNEKLRKLKNLLKKIMG